MATLPQVLHKSMARQIPSLMNELGWQYRFEFALSPSFYLALAAGPVVLFFLGMALPSWHEGIRPDWRIAFSFLLWQPLVEEMLFRGVVQGSARRQAWGVRAVLGISLANVVTSLVFMVAHLVQHPPLWALAVLAPSLVFGYVRDRYGHILPSLILHIAYNACYLAWR